MDLIASLRLYRISYSACVLMAALSIYYTYRLLIGDLYVEELGWVSALSVPTFSIAFIGPVVLLSLRNDEPNVGDLDAFVIGLATMTSMIWTYELIFRYSYGFYEPNYPSFDWRPMITDGMIAALVLVGWRHIRVRGNWAFGLSVGVFAGLQTFWLLIGFPTPDGIINRDQVIVVADPVGVGFFLNRVTKFALAVAWALMYCPTRRSGESNSRVKEAVRHLPAVR